jgi:CheY-like chemotaxis protein/DNA-directed RNA polymerase specialized sigma24 family protein
MTISSSIVPHLPYLRRFARAVSGNQTSGDAYALATLEAIVADTEALSKDLEPRVALYQVFLRVWGSVAFGAEDRSRGDSQLQPPNPTSIGLQRGVERLEALTPRSRVAFVLSAIEGFGTEQIALALGCAPKDAEALLHRASIEISHQIATDVLIVEDEPIIAMDIEALVESLGHRVTEVARTHAEALAAVRRRRPGLILADVQLADGSSGINAVHEILSSFRVPVIFITAYPERLLTGERPEPTFLISKPFRHEMVKAVISQALFFDQKASAPEKIAGSAG